MLIGDRGGLPRAALAALLVAGCGGQDSSETYEAPPVTVEAVRVQGTDFEEIAEFTGALTAAESVIVRPEASGTVEEIAAEEGQSVREDDLLFVLRNDEERARVAEAKAARDLNQRNYDRVNSLKGNDILSLEELDRARSELAQADARLQIAEVELRRTEIRAPFDGVLGPRMVSRGDRVTGGAMSRRGDQTGMVQIDSIDELKLVFTVPEVAINAIAVGTPLEVSVTPFPDERFSGEVYFVAPSLDPGNRRLPIKALIPNLGHRLRPGLSCTVFLPLGRREGVLLVPESAIVRDVAGTFVWRVDSGNTAKRVAVELGTRRPGVVEITRGLNEGDLIVSAGTNKVSEGRDLSVVDPRPKSGPPS